MLPFTHFIHVVNTKTGYEMQKNGSNDHKTTQKENNERVFRKDNIKLITKCIEFRHKSFEFSGHFPLFSAYVDFWLV